MGAGKIKMRKDGTKNQEKQKSAQPTKPENFKKWFWLKNLK